jgi:hypothetical protein
MNRWLLAFLAPFMLLLSTPVFAQDCFQFNITPGYRSTLDLRDYEQITSVVDSDGNAVDYQLVAFSNGYTYPLYRALLPADKSLRKFDISLTSKVRNLSYNYTLCASRYSENISAWNSAPSYQRSFDYYSSDEQYFQDYQQSRFYRYERYRYPTNFYFNR